MTFPALDATTRRATRSIPSSTRSAAPARRRIAPASSASCRPARSPCHLGRASPSSSSATGHARRRSPTSSRSCSPSVCVKRDDRRSASPIPPRASSSGTPDPVLARRDRRASRLPPARMDRRAPRSRRLRDAHLPGCRPAALRPGDPNDPVPAARSVSEGTCRRRRSCSRPIRRCFARAGCSTRKGATLRALAQRFVDGRLSDDALARMTDEEVEAALTEVSGIGPWTAHGFLIVALDRPDVLLSGDLALRHAVQRLYGLDHLPTEAEMVEVAERWRPYRSLAVSYLFASGVRGSHDDRQSASSAPAGSARRWRASRCAPAASVVIANSRGPESLDVSGLGPRRGSLGRHAGRGCCGGDRRHRRALGPRARSGARPRLERSGRHRRDQRLGGRRSRRENIERDRRRPRRRRACREGRQHARRRSARLRPAARPAASA